MPQIKLDEFCTLERVPNNWVLTVTKPSLDKNGKQKVNKKGEPVTSKKETFHGSAEQALKSYVDVCLEPTKSVEEMLEMLHWIKNRINEINI